MRYEEESVYTDASRGTQNRSVATDEENSYYTKFSEGSMGLSKRKNNELSLVSYVPMGEDSSTTDLQEREDGGNDNRCSADARDEDNRMYGRRRRSKSRSRRARDIPIEFLRSTSSS